jgi:hypothetical protein
MGSFLAPQITNLAFQCAFQSALVEARRAELLSPPRQRWEGFIRRFERRRCGTCSVAIHSIISRSFSALKTVGCEFLWFLAKLVWPGNAGSHPHIWTNSSRLARYNAFFALIGCGQPCQSAAWRVLTLFTWLDWLDGGIDWLDLREGCRGEILQLLHSRIISESKDIYDTWKKISEAKQRA